MHSKVLVENLVRCVSERRAIISNPSSWSALYKVASEKEANRMIYLDIFLCHRDDVFREQLLRSGDSLGKI